VVGWCLLYPFKPLKEKRDMANGFKSKEKVKNNFIMSNNQLKRIDEIKAAFSRFYGYNLPVTYFYHEAMKEYLDKYFPEYEVLNISIWGYIKQKRDQNIRYRQRRSSNEPL